MITNTLIAICYVLIGTFDSLLTFIGMPSEPSSCLSMTTYKFDLHQASPNISSSF